MKIHLQVYRVIGVWQQKSGKGPQIGDGDGTVLRCAPTYIVDYQNCVLRTAY